MSTMTSERQAFEAMVRKWPNYSERTLTRDGRAPDYYGSPVVQGAWEGWKARAHLAQPAQAVDVGAILGYAYRRLMTNGEELSVWEFGTHKPVPGSVAELIEIRNSVLPAPLTGEKAAQVVEINATELKIEAWPPRPDGMCVYAPKGVKVTHMPTGITVACDDERSGHMNRDKALRGLAAMLPASPAPDKEGL